MKWICLVLVTLGSIQAFSNEDEEFFALDSEIEALLEEDDLDEYTGLEEESLHEVNISSPIQNSVQSIEVQENEAESIGIEVDRIVAEEETMIEEHPKNPIEVIKQETAQSVQAIEINLKQVFSGSPIIYTLLFFLSIISMCIWLYSMLTIRSVEFLPPSLVKDLRTKLISNQFDDALDLCVKQKHFFCKMLASGILARKHGLNVMIDTMKAEGKRSTISFWQRIGILNEVAIIAPMLGLLGTVMGMFYAFYDLNRSIESVSLLFDGLGISVGTTVAGLIVAILAMILHSLAKYRLVKILANVENEAQTFAALIDTRSPNYLEK